METKRTELSQSGSEAWDDINSCMDLTWEAMNVAVKSARNRFFK